MASLRHQQQRLLFSLLMLLSLFSIAVHARPCSTFFISYSFSIDRSDPNPNPNPNPTTISFFPNHHTVFAQFKSIQPSRFFLDRRFPATSFIPLDRPQIPPRRSSPSSSSVASSLRDRTKDIISVLVALLFGVGCGFLTAGTLYLAWSLFSNRFYFDAHHDGAYDQYEDADSDVFSPKKGGYVKIPAADPAPLAVDPAPVAHPAPASPKHAV